MTQEKVALVTAASRGIGAACAEGLAERGYRVALLARSEEVMALAERLGGLGVKGSVAEEGDLRRLVENTLESYGRIDGAVINTGHPPKGELLEITDEDWHRGLELLLLPAVRLARLLTPTFEAQGGGAMVNISTVGAEEPNLKFPVSSTLRAALAAFTKLYGDRFGAAGIRFNSVLPGFADSYEVDDATRSTIPLGREATVAEVASGVAFLLSEEASYITGQSLRVDGGMARSL